MSKAKDILRKEIALNKKKYTLSELVSKSDEVFSVLEITGTFQNAKHVFIYNSLKDEVSTHAFIDRWKGEKNFYLPVVENDNLKFRKYENDGKFELSGLGIIEPLGTDFTDYSKVDIIIVPGMAFDRKMNRMGRGKGYYDRFLPRLKATRIGVCFDYQLFDAIPHDERDVKMDMIISENDLIW